jgi:S1-C subfamily serine protease
MKFNSSTLNVCVGCLFIVLSTQTPNIITHAQVGFDNLLARLSSEPLSRDQLCSIAKLISVKIGKGENWGSGILVKKHGTRYTVLTNGHVLKEGEEKYIIQTPDGQKHEASLLVRFDHGKSTGNDMAFLQFDSTVNYQVAALAKWAVGENILAGGFPLQPDPSLPQGFLCTQLEQVSRKLEQPMQNGYQLGYFLTIYKGMSGGLLLNEKGRVVGMNGMGQPVLFTNPDIYLYTDGKRVSESLGLPSAEAMNLLSNSSWAIPSEKIVYLSPSGLNLKLDSDKDSNSSVRIPSY